MAVIWLLSTVSPAVTENGNCRFIPANFETMFSKYASKVPDKLTLKEIWHMTQANSVAYDFFGWSVLSFSLNVTLLVDPTVLEIEVMEFL